MRPRRFPWDVHEQFVLKFGEELRLMTDHLTDELFAVPAAKGRRTPRSMEFQD
jgi:hypothetical protein